MPATTCQSNRPQEAVALILSWPLMVQVHFNKCVQTNSSDSDFSPIILPVTKIPTGKLQKITDHSNFDNVIKTASCASW